MPENVLAKGKKVKYLGHNYEGMVDKSKVPSGEGAINVSGLIIEGIFNATTITDAEVHRTTYLGPSTTTFKGTITFDESDKITLKAGGTISTKYHFRDDFNNISESTNEVTETLQEDKVVNSDNFEPRSIKIPHTITPEIDNVLDPPSEFSTHYDIKLEYDYPQSYHQIINNKG